MKPALRALLGVAILGAVACTDEDPCEAAALADALRAASPGDTVSVGECRITGAFTVPSGVILAGSGEGSVIVGTGAAPAVDLIAASTATTVRNLVVESPSGVGVRVTGASGMAAIRDVTVVVERGIGIGAREVASLEIAGSTVRGPVTAATADAVPPSAGTDTGSFGLVLVDVGSDASRVVVSSSSVQNVGPWGAILIRSFVDWQAGGVSTVVGTGIYVGGGAARLEGVSVATVLQGLQAVPAYALVSTGSAVVETTGSTFTGSEGLGLLHAGTVASHTDLTASGHRFGAMWVQDSAGVSVLGASMLSDNRLAAVVAVRSSNLVIDGARIERTTEQVSIYGESVGVTTADGVQVIDPAGTHTLRGVTFADNERVGFLADLGIEPVERLALESVTVSGTGDALGAIAQDGTGLVAGGWDSGVVRMGAPLTNDPARATPLGIVGALPASNVPAPGTVAP